MRAEKKYPECSLHKYVSIRFKQLEKWGCVERIRNSTGIDTWKITGKLR
jgi:hypothetical protein